MLSLLRFCIVASVLTTAIFLPSFGSLAQSGLTVADLPPSSNLLDWVAKDVCVNSTNTHQLVAFDPYYTCPSGTVRRKIQAGDPLPYHNMDQYGFQQSDSYPMLDASGNTIYMHTFDYAPFNTYNLHSGSDGFEIYNVNKSWFSTAETRDGGGYGQEFYGANCTYGLGWIVFPASGFLTAGQTALPIADSYWEQNGTSYPGACPAGYYSPLTYWWEQKQVQFGGINGNPTKTMNAMISYHGFVAGQQAPMEVVWFTRQYGLTMWQAWLPLSQKPTKTKNCIAADTVTYMGVVYVVSDCHDWSSVKLSTTAAIPQWPLPPANLLKHSHFDNGGGYLPNNDTSLGTWHRGGASKEGNIINWSLINSTAPQDMKYGSGLRVLAANCGGTCTGPAVQEIYQDVSIDQISNGGTYLYGIDTHTATGVGTIQVTLQELDNNGKVLWQDFVTGTAKQDNGDGRNNEAVSHYLTTAFIGKTAAIPVYAGATKLRFYITPLTSQTFYILDSWLDRFPAITGTVSVASLPVAAVIADLRREASSKNPIP